MPERLRCVDEKALIAGWDFSTGGVKCLVFDVTGQLICQTRLPTDLYHGQPPEPGRSELSLFQLEGQARASTRAIAAELRSMNRLHHWAAGGISATHHTAGRIDENRVQVRRAICWNDHTLAAYHRKGLRRLGGQKKVQELIGGPWAIRYSLSHLVKDEETLDADSWKRTWRMLPHGALAAGFLTGNFDAVSVSAAASTGIMDLPRRRWERKMLEAVSDPSLRKLAWKQLPPIVDHCEPLGPLSDSLALEAGIDTRHRPLVFPTSDDQQAGLVGGGAVDDGQLAIVLGNSAVVNSSSNNLPSRGKLDVMCLNWGPYLWMRCYNNGAQFLDQIVGPAPDWKGLEKAGRRTKPGCGGTILLPFIAPEPSLGVTEPNLRWLPKPPGDEGTQYRASLEALAYLMALGVAEHEQAGQEVTRITVSGGIARSELMCEILASVLNRPLERLESDEGPALGAAVTALAALETHLRKERRIEAPMTVADAAAQMVRFRGRTEPNPEWVKVYQAGLKKFRAALK